jgi:sirohydrochlorin cobaltochelatase
MEAKRMEDHTAVLIVSFGTTHLDTLERSILATEDAIADSFHGCQVYRAFLSPTVMRRLKERHGVYVDTVEEALASISRDGHNRVIAQPTLLIGGFEYDLLLKELDTAKNLQISVGRPLLADRADCEKLASIIMEENPLGEKEALVLMGHGTEHKANAIYHLMQEVFESRNYHCLIGTVEGTPSFRDVAERLEEDGTLEARLLPLMFVAGDHAKNDMAGEEDSLLSLVQTKGIRATPIFRGLGESRKVQEIYVAHAWEAFKIPAKKY